VATVTGAFCALSQGRPAVGTTIVSDVGDAATTAAATPLIATAFDESARNPLPVIVAVTPGESDAGEIEAIVGATEPAGATTSTVTVADTPPIDAVSVAVPGLDATSCPAPFTVATSGADELYVMRRPSAESTVPSPALRTISSGVVVPATTDPASGVIETAATVASTTVTCVAADFSPIVAVIIAEPGDTPVTTPSATVATAGLEVDHVGTRPVIAAPAASRMSATSVSVAPTWSAPRGSDTVSDATTGPDGWSGPVVRFPSPHARLSATRTRGRTTRIRPARMKGATLDARVAHEEGSRAAQSPVDPAPPVARHTPPGVSLPLTPWRRQLKTATFETNRGTITAELYDKEAPKTVENFEKLANSGFYDGVKFHRVIPDFVVQGGDPYSRDLPEGDPRVGTGGPGWRIKCETAGNPRKHEVGALSMAHAGKDTGGSQFFMVLSEDNTRHLNGVHTVFGKITGGLDVMKQIKKNDVMNKVRVA